MVPSFPHGRIVVVRGKRRLIGIVVLKRLQMVKGRGRGRGSQRQVLWSIGFYQMLKVLTSRNHFPYGGIVFKDHFIHSNLSRQTSPCHGIIMLVVNNIITSV